MRDLPCLSRLSAPIVACLLAFAGGVLVAAQPAKQGRTVWDGVYTDAQAARATAVFSTSCSNCHTHTPEGSNSLIGDKFWKGYTQKTVADLLTFVSTNMPNGNGGSLAAPTYNDLVALILKSNRFPAGMTELAPDTIANVEIIPKNGPGELPAGALVRLVGCLTKIGSDWVLKNATVPERIERTGPGPEDATRPLGDRTMTLKFVVTRLDSYLGQRMSASGILMGAGGTDGMNVTTVSRVAEACP